MNLKKFAIDVTEDCASLRGEELSGSLLGTWPPVAYESIADKASRSRHCRIGGQPWDKFVAAAQKLTEESGKLVRLWQERAMRRPWRIR